MAVTSMKINDDKRVELEISVDAGVFGKALDEAFKKNVGTYGRFSEAVKVIDPRQM